MVDKSWIDYDVWTRYDSLSRIYLQQANLQGCIIINNPCFNLPLDYYCSLEQFDNITEIMIQSYLFDQPLERLPKNIKKIKLNCINFNRPISNLPSTIEFIEIHSIKFNQLLDNLPVNLKTLNLRCEIFNQPLDYLPIILENFSLYSKNYSYNLDNLPTNMLSLELVLSNYEIKFISELLSKSLSKMKIKLQNISMELC